MADSLEQVKILDGYQRLLQSGADFAGNAGGECPIYLGTDATLQQILSRLAVRHWLDVCPVAAVADSGSPFAETWEFSATGDMTQGELESAGWTFNGCNGQVIGGLFELTGTSTSAANPAELAVNLTGDFDIVAAPVIIPGTRLSASYWRSGIAIGDTTGDVGYTARQVLTAGYARVSKLKGFTYSTHGGGTDAEASVQSYPNILRVCRVSGTVYVSAGVPGYVHLINQNGARIPTGADGWISPASAADASAFNRLSLGIGANLGDGIKNYWRFIRRYA